MSYPRPVILLSLLLYVVACGAVAFTGPEVTYRGFECLLLGGLTLLSLASYPIWFIAWGANLLFVPALYSAIKGRTSAGRIGLAAASVVTGLSSLHVRSVLPDGNRVDVPVAPGPGLYLWLGALALGLAAQLILYQRYRRGTSVNGD
jgi:hypothetical protein